MFFYLRYYCVYFIAAIVYFVIPQALAKLSACCARYVKICLFRMTHEYRD